MKRVKSVWLHFSLAHQTCNKVTKPFILTMNAEHLVLAAGDKVP